MVEKHEYHNHLRDFLGEGSQVDLFWVYSNKVDVLAVSERFQNLKLDERQQLIRQWQQSIDPQFEIMLMSLYTPDEAVELGVEILEETEHTGVPSTWLELIEWGHQGRKIVKHTQSPKTIAFYSFKGGVGRTTALVHSAWALAAKGKRVVMVDLDFEAPSLHRTREMKVPAKGLVDYLYERTNLFGDEQPQISIADTIGEIDVPKGKLFVVSAGKVDIDYIAKVDDLRNLSVYDHRLWDEFRSELVEQLQPDIILIDSRTGINIWGALSMLTIADKSILFMNPNPQNIEGMDTILTSLIKVGIEPYVVMSQVLGDIGREKALKRWRTISESIDRVRPKPEVIEGAEVFSALDSMKEPMMIPYASEIAIADEFPVPAFLKIYERIVEILDDESEKHEFEPISDELRREVLESFAFTALDARTDDTETVAKLFVKTDDYDSFTDPNNVLILGKKGAGKTTLYWMLLNHLDLMKKWRPSRFREVTACAIYGEGVVAPDLDQLKEIGEELTQRGLGWVDFWASFTFMQFNKNVTADVWTKENTDDLLLYMALGIEAHIKAISEKNLQAQVWFLYDDLDHLPQDVLIGLFTFAASLEKIGKKNIRPKIFLRNDIWHLLEYREKTQFVGRNIELKWSQNDVTRFIFKQVIQSEKFAGFVEHLLIEFDEDQVPEEVLEKCLEVLWGDSKLTVLSVLGDSERSIFPRTLITLLLGMRDEEFKMKHTAKNRFIGGYAFIKGINRAIVFRCTEIKNEFSRLDEMGFFSLLRDLEAKSELHSWWLEHAQQDYKTFETLLEKIEHIGLARIDEERCDFPILCCVGFNMKSISIS